MLPDVHSQRGSGRARGQGGLAKQVVATARPKVSALLYFTRCSVYSETLGTKARRGFQTEDGGARSRKTERILKRGFT